MFYIDYKADGKTACIKQARGMEYICEAKNGAKIYAKANEAGDYRKWYYTVGGVDGLLLQLDFRAWATPDEMREVVDFFPAERAARAFPDRDTRLAILAERVNGGQWTSNGDALFCELCGEFELAEQVRKNREEYRKQQNEEREAEKHEREQQEAERKAEEERARAEALERAEQELKAGRYISAEHFEELAAKHGIPLSVKFVGWLRKWCGGVRIRAGEDGERDIVYRADKKHKSTSIWAYADKLGEACGI